MANKRYWVYILTNPDRIVLYIGMTNDIQRRLYEHKEKVVEGFSKRYNCTVLIYLEETSSIKDAIAREKQLKNWSRSKKEWLIALQNPSWSELVIE